MLSPRIITRTRFEDERGSFERLFAADELSDLGVNIAAYHVNLSRMSHVGTVKGFHMQRTPHAEVKIVTCIAGRIFDVAVDLRGDSKSYGTWFGVELDADAPLSLLIPEGFAHGLQSLERNSVIHYVHSTGYESSSEIGVHPLDPDIAVPWPHPPSRLSPRDSTLPTLAQFVEVER